MATARAPAAGRARRAALPPGSHLAFVLHQWDWSETSLILDLFTRDFGRVAAVAKGAKRPYSQLRPVLMPFQRLLVQLPRPRGAAGADDGGAEILGLRGAEFAGIGAPLPPARLFAGFYCNELLMRQLARGDPHAALFDAYADTLQALAAGDADGDGEAALRAFELLLLRHTGVLPDLAVQTPTQQPVQPTRGHRLDAEAGVVAAAPGADGATLLSGSALLALQQALQADDPARLRTACQPVLPALKLQVRALLQQQLGAGPLRTRQLVLDVRRLLDSA